MNSLIIKAGFAPIYSEIFRKSVEEHGEKLLSHVHDVEEIQNNVEKSLIRARCVRQVICVSLS